jgi:hypothetical protein
VIGAVVIVGVLLVLIPVLVFLTGGVVAALIGHLLTRDVEKEYEGTEYATLT